MREEWEGWVNVLWHENGRAGVCEYVLRVLPWCVYIHACECCVIGAGVHVCVNGTLHW